MRYVGLATGKVVHITKPNSSVHKQGWNDYALTLCGRRFATTRWFEAGISPYGEKKPENLPVCQRCAAEQAGAVDASPRAEKSDELSGSRN